MNAAAGATVGKLLQSRPETLGLDVEMLAGSGGLDRRIVSLYTQKTSLQLAGLDEIDESEIEDVPYSGEEH
jgi:hypothetical protein